jgi:hypothetical protein
MTTQCPNCQRSTSDKISMCICGHRFGPPAPRQEVAPETKPKPTANFPPRMIVSSEYKVIRSIDPWDFAKIVGLVTLAFAVPYGLIVGTIEILTGNLFVGLFTLILSAPIAFIFSYISTLITTYVANYFLQRNPVRVELN